VTLKQNQKVKGDETGKTALSELGTLEKAIEASGTTNKEAAIAAFDKMVSEVAIDAKFAVCHDYKTANTKLKSDDMQSALKTYFTLHPNETTYTKTYEVRSGDKIQKTKEEFVVALEDGKYVAKAPETKTTTK